MRLLATILSVLVFVVLLLPRLLVFLFCWLF